MFSHKRGRDAFFCTYKSISLLYVHQERICTGNTTAKSMCHFSWSWRLYPMLSWFSSSVPESAEVPQHPFWFPSQEIQAWQTSFPRRPFALEYQPSSTICSNGPGQTAVQVYNTSPFPLQCKSSAVPEFRLRPLLPLEDPTTLSIKLLSSSSGRKNRWRGGNKVCRKLMSQIKTALWTYLRKGSKRTATRDGTAAFFGFWSRWCWSTMLHHNADMMSSLQSRTCAPWLFFSQSYKLSAQCVPWLTYVSIQTVRCTCV